MDRKRGRFFLCATGSCKQRGIVEMVDFGSQGGVPRFGMIRLVENSVLGLFGIEGGRGRETGKDKKEEEKKGGGECFINMYLYSS